MGLEEHGTTYRKIRNTFKILIRKSKGKEDHMKDEGVDGMCLKQFECEDASGSECGPVMLP